MSPIGPFLALVRPEKLSLLTILEIMRLQGSGGVILGMKMTRALIAVGKAVENEYKAEMCKLHDIPLPQFSRRYDAFTLTGYSHLHQRRVAAAATNEDGEVWTATWTQVARAKVGAVLVECLMDVAQIGRSSVDPETGEVVYV
jgi:DNA-directed RNA polymerase